MSNTEISIDRGTTYSRVGGDENGKSCVSLMSKRVATTPHPAADYVAKGYVERLGTYNAEITPDELDKPNVERQIQYARDERAAILHKNPILRMSYTEAKVQGE